MAGNIRRKYPTARVVHVFLLITCHLPPPRNSRLFTRLGAYYKLCNFFQKKKLQLESLENQPIKCLSLFLPLSSLNIYPRQKQHLLERLETRASEMRGRRGGGVREGGNKSRGGGGGGGYPSNGRQPYYGNSIIKAQIYHQITCVNWKDV